MSLRTTMITAGAVAAVATGGILPAPAGATAGAKCDRGHEKVREGTVMHTRLGTWYCRNGHWSVK